MKLQGKLIVVIVMAIVAAMLLLASVVFAQLRQQSERELFGQMQLLLDQTQQQTQSFVDNAAANAELFSNSNLMDRYVLVEDEAERYDLMQPAMLRLFTKYQQAYPEYRELRLILPDGYEDTRFAQPGLPNLTEEEAETPYFLAMLDSGTDIMTKVLENPDDGQTTLLVSVPIYRKTLRTAAIAAEPVLRGFMAVTASLVFLENQIIHQRIGQSGYLVAVNRRNRIVFHPRASMIGQDATALIRHLADSEDPPSRSDSLREGTVETRTEGESVYVRGRWLHPDLMLLSVLPKSEFRASRQTLAVIVALISAGAIALTSLMLFLLLRTLVVSPVRQLRQLAIAVGEGRNADVSHKHLERGDEIGDLARAFQDMHTKLGSSIQQLQHSHAKIEQLAYRDSLTGLPNRRLFLELVEETTNKSRHSQRHSAVLFLDLDDFKRVNDTLGHEAGDALLKEVAGRLSNCLRQADVTVRGNACQGAAANTGAVARLGGDEFIILINDLDEAMNARIVAERILASLRQPFVLMEQKFVVGASIGIALFPDNGSDADTLIKCADIAMYAAKRQEKNTYRFYGDAMRLGIQARLEIERDLRIAVDEQAFELHFQPQFDTRTEQVIGAEVLLRWHHSERGNVPPDQFISIAEDTGLIGPLGEWIISEACRQWKAWERQGIAPPRLAVNVSRRQFKLSDLVQVVSQALTGHQMPADALELEITESCMMEARAEVVESLGVLRNMGVRIAMDDFGTGYSSLGALTSLPIDTLKIDRSFVTGVEIGEANEKIVSAILLLAHNLGLEVVAEGVETRSEHHYLLEKGCEVCQGYLFSKPLPAEQMTELLFKERARLDETSLRRAS